MVKPFDTGGSVVSDEPMTLTTASTGAAPSLATVSGPFSSSSADIARLTAPTTGAPLTISFRSRPSSAMALAASSIHACSCVDV